MAPESTLVSCQNNDFSNCNFIQDLSTAIVQGFQNKLKNASQQSSQSEKNINDWWNADQKYFVLDGKFEDVSKQFYQDFAIFDQLAYQGQQDQLKLNKTAITLNLLINSISLSDLINQSAKGALQYSPHPDINSKSNMGTRK